MVLQLCLFHSLFDIPLANYWNIWQGLFAFTLNYLISTAVNYPSTFSLLTGSEQKQAGTSPDTPGSEWS